MKQKPEHLSWDIEREHAPERPIFIASITEDALIDRPQRVTVAYALVAIAVVCTIAVNVLAALGFDAIHESMLTVIPDDLAETYTEEDLDRAVNLLLVSAAVLTLVLALLQLASMHSCHAQRRASGRAWLIALTVLALPVSFLGMLLRAGDTLDMAMSAVAALCLIAAIVLLATPIVSQWLRQRERPRSTPLTDLKPAQD